MEQKQILDYIEDKTITIENKWFFHATDRDIITIKKIVKNLHQIKINEYNL